MESTQLLSAVAAAQAGNWHEAHHIVQQDEADPLACWIHAVLHKIEGDAWNSKYWYARTSREYQDWSDPDQELAAIRAAIGEGRG